MHFNSIEFQLGGNIKFLNFLPSLQQFQVIVLLLFNMRLLSDNFNWISTNDKHNLNEISAANRKRHILWM